MFLESSSGTRSMARGPASGRRPARVVAMPPPRWHRAGSTSQVMLYGENLRGAKPSLTPQVP
ncbi:MAG: hypothetical protein ACREPJ_10845 [Rhodanobacteraceae bacterium]